MRVTYDSIVAEIEDEQEQFWKLLVAAKDQRIADLSRSLDSCQAENEQLLAILASKPDKAGISLDSIANKPVKISLDSTERLLRDKDFFKNQANLPTFDDIQNRDTKGDGQYRSLASRFF